MGNPPPITTALVDIAKLKTDPGNARSHDDRNLDKITYSLKAFGQQKPIVIDSDNVVVAGNGTIEAARALGWTRISAVVTDLTGDDRTAYALADNRTNELSGWDHDILASQLQALLEEDVDVEALGWDADEIALLIDPKGRDVDAPEVFEEIKTDELGLDCRCPKCGFEWGGSS